MHIFDTYGTSQQFQFNPWITAGGADYTKQVLFLVKQLRERMTKFNTSQFCKNSFIYTIISHISNMQGTDLHTFKLIPS